MTSVASEHVLKKPNYRLSRPVSESLFKEAPYNIHENDARREVFQLFVSYYKLRATGHFPTQRVDTESSDNQYFDFDDITEILRERFADAVSNATNDGILLCHYLASIWNTHESTHFPHIQITWPALADRHAIIELFVNTCELWNLNDDQQLTLLGYSSHNSVRRHILDDYLNELPRDVEDRAGYVVGISFGLNALYGGNIEAEISWLQLRRKKFDGKSAIEFMLEGSLVNLFVISEMVKRERGI